MLTGALAFTGNDTCRDLTDYSDLTYINQTVTVCHTELKKTCTNKTEEECMDVTELECEVELFTNCSTDWNTLEVTKSQPATLSKTLPTCTKQSRKEKHEKTDYDCKMVTKKQCTTLWEVVNGEKVWAGNDDDCKDVTWEECSPVTVEVEWDVPFMNCINTTYSYLSYEDTTTEVMADTMDCKVLPRTVCKPRPVKKCDSITFTTCSKKPVEECHEEMVPSPSKEKIHRQWCLFGQYQGRFGEERPEPVDTGYNAGRTNRATDTNDTEEEFNSISGVVDLKIGDLLVR